MGKQLRRHGHGRFFFFRIFISLLALARPRGLCSQVNLPLRMAIKAPGRPLSNRKSV